MSVPGLSTPARRGDNPLARLIFDRKLNTKILLAIGVMAFVAIVVGVLSISRMGSLNTSTHDVYEQGMLRQQAINNARQKSWHACQPNCSSWSASSGTDPDPNPNRRGADDVARVGAPS